MPIVPQAANRISTFATSTRRVSLIRPAPHSGREREGRGSGGGGLPDPRKPCHVRDSVLLATQEALALQLLVQHVQGALYFGGVPCIRNATAPGVGVPAERYGASCKACAGTSTHGKHATRGREGGRRAYVGHRVPTPQGQLRAADAMKRGRRGDQPTLEIPAWCYFDPCDSKHQTLALESRRGLPSLQKLDRALKSAKHVRECRSRILPVDRVVELHGGISCEVAELPKVRSLADLSKKHAASGERGRKGTN